MGFPDDPTALQVRAAFGANLSDSLSTLDYTDISDYTRPRVVIARGRVGDAVQTGPTLIGTRLRNPEGIFSPRNIAGPYYGRLRRQTPLQVRLDPGTGMVTRGIAYVPEWPPRWTGPDIDDRLELEAGGILRRLGAGQDVRSALRRMIVFHGPVNYWPMEDGTEAGIAGSAVSGGKPLSISGTVDFATAEGPPGSLPLPSNLLDLGGELTGAGTGSASTSWGLSFIVSFPPDNYPDEAILGAIASWTVPGHSLFARFRLATFFGEGFGISLDAFDSFGTEFTILGSGDSADITRDVFHHVLIWSEQSGGNIVSTMYFDGVLVNTDTRAGTNGATGIGDLTVSPVLDEFAITATAANVSVGHWAIYDDAIAPVLGLQDTFTRTVANGWGTADTGEIWSRAGGAASDFSVASGQGKHLHSAAGSIKESFVDIGSTEWDYYVDLSWPVNAATGATITRWICGRYANNNNYYVCRLDLNSAGAVVMLLAKRVAGTFTALTSTVTVDSTYVADTVYRVRFSGAVGTSGGITLSARAWIPAAESDPSTWLLTYSELAPSLTSGTNIGLLDRAEVGNTNVPVTLSWDNLVVYVADTPAIVAGEQTEAMGGHDGELAADRFARLCTQLGLAYDVTAGDSQPMGPQLPGTDLDLLRECEAADEAVMPERVTGELGFDPRVSRYNIDVTMTLDYEQGHVTDLVPGDDDRDLVNRVTVTRVGGASATWERTDGPLGTDPDTGVGAYQDGVNRSLQSDDDALQHATWLVNKGTVDEPRYQARVDLLAHPELVDDWLASDIGSRIQVTNPPEDHTGPAPLDLIIEGYQETIDAAEWYVDLYLMPYRPYEVFEIETGDGNRSRVPAGVSTIDATYDEDDASLSVTSAVKRWIDSATYPSMFPIDIEIAGEVMRCTAITGTGLTQTFTVTRGLHGVAKTLPSGSAVQLWRPPVIAL